MYHERKTVDQGGNYQSGEGKYKPYVEILVKKSSEHIRRTEGKEQVESEYGGGKDQGQADYRFNGQF